jgi:hypothetical protein
MCAYFAHIISDVLTCLHEQLIFATDAMTLGQLGVPVFFRLLLLTLVGCSICLFQCTISAQWPLLGLYMKLS